MTQQCYMVQQPRIAIVYIFPVNGSLGFAEKALRFVDSYLKHPPGLDHQTIIVCNGHADESSRGMFRQLPNLTFLEHDNSGWDIGGFQLAARTIDCDMMVFFGSHAYFRGEGWLARMYDAFLHFGDTLYGCTGNQGNGHVQPHVRTTGFWCSPGLLARYPHQVTQSNTGGQRYEMEHGQNCFTSWVRSHGKVAWIVGWDSALSVLNCDAMPNGLHRGNQENVITGDRLTGPPYFHTP